MPHRELSKDYTFTLYESADRIHRADWDAITGGQSVFLERDYLSIVEHGEHTRLQCRYVIIYHRTKPCAVIYFQIIDFKAGLFGSLMNREVETIRSTRMNLFEKYIDSNKEEVLLRLFTCGNNLISGEYGFIFDKRTGPVKANELLLSITDLVAKEEKLRGTISAILLKDFYKPLKPASLLEDQKYTQFSVEPNLIVDIPSHVKTMEDYTALFSKKYRNRAKSVFKSLDGIGEKYLSVDEIVKHEKTIYSLYTEIFNKAKFKLIKLPEHYFSAVKKAYPDKFFIKGYLEDGKLIAFASYFVLTDGTLEAHYIGLSYAKNQEYDLYQNILYTMIEEGIKYRCNKVNLGRTAAEIKTTVGARPKDLVCYIKPQNTISRLIQNPFISYLQPAAWTPRNPFKEAETQTSK